MATDDPDRHIVQARLDKGACRTLLHALNYTCEKWPGGDPSEQENLIHMREMMFRMMLEFQMEEAE